MIETAEEQGEKDAILSTVFQRLHPNKNDPVTEYTCKILITAH